MLVARYYFYMSWNAKYVFLILFTTIIFSVKLLESCLAHPYEFFLNSNTADFLRTITSDTNDFYQAVINVLMIATNGFTAIAICIYLLITNVVITLVITFAWLICAGVILLVLNKK